jgi:hypothetical protein
MHDEREAPSRYQKLVFHLSTIYPWKELHELFATCQPYRNETNLGTRHQTNQYSDRKKNKSTIQNLGGLQQWVAFTTGLLMVSFC